MPEEVVYLTTSQVAQRFQVDPSVVRRWVAEKRITPAIVTLGGHYRFKESDIETYERNAS